MRGDRASTLFRSIDMRELPTLYADGSRYVLVLADKGTLEREGIGLGGDPLSPDGDVLLLHELRRLLTPRGVLVATLPLAARDGLVGWPSLAEPAWRARRMYGPARLPRLLEGFDVLACVSEGALRTLAEVKATLARCEYHEDSVLCPEREVTLVLRAREGLSGSTVQL